MANNNATPEQMDLLNQLVTLFEVTTNQYARFRQILVQLSGQILELERHERTVGRRIAGLKDLLIGMQQREIETLERVVILNREIEALGILIGELRRQVQPPPPPRPLTRICRCPTHVNPQRYIRITRVIILGEIHWICPFGKTRTCEHKKPLGQNIRDHIRRCRKNITIHNWTCPGPPECN